MNSLKSAFITIATLSLVSAKLDYGPCPTGIQQIPYNPSIDGTYYLQFYDEMLDYLKPIVS